MLTKQHTPLCALPVLCVASLPGTWDRALPRAHVLFFCYIVYPTSSQLVEAATADAHISISTVATTEKIDLQKIS